MKGGGHLFPSSLLFSSSFLCRRGPSSPRRVPRRFSSTTWVLRADESFLGVFSELVTCSGPSGVVFNGEISGSSFHTEEFSNSSSERCPGAGVASMLGPFRGLKEDAGFLCFSTTGTAANFGTGKSQ